MSVAEPEQVQTRRFLLLYALAWAGGSIAYVPFLTILLPVRVTEVAAADSLGWLAHIAFIGAIAASAANIGFGWLSDVTGNRRGWSALGLLLSCCLLIAIAQVRDFMPLILLIVAWQLALNMMLAPLAAWAGDCVPHRQKGALGGLLALAPAVGAASGALVTIPGLADNDQRLWLVAGAVALCVLPVLLLGRPRSFPDLMRGEQAPLPFLAAMRALMHSAAARMWLARLLIQISEAALFSFLYLWLRTLDGRTSDNEAAGLLSFVLAGAIPITFLAGRWSDRNDRPALPLALASGVAGLGLLVMGLSDSLVSGVAGYFLFGLAATTFLSLHSAQTLRFLNEPERRGRDLGIFNLTNTVPSLVMPWLTLALVPLFGFGALFALLAALALLAGGLLLSVSARR